MTNRGLRDATIMMVDDELTTIEITELFLKEAGFRRFIPSTDPREALDLIRRERPDVLLLDLVMPRVDGLEILSEVRNDEALQHTPVIILTVSTDADAKLRALELGVTDFLSKPVDPSELVLRLDNTLVVRRHQLHLERLVEERTAELNVMRLRAEQASEAKSRFLANMSHELRTPMTAIAGYTEVLLENPQLSAEQHQSLQAIKRNGDKLLGLIGTLLDLCQIETGDLQIECKPLDLAQQVRRVTQALQPRARDRGLDLRIEVPGRVPALLLCDGARIQQALLALLSNALKFTREGSICVRLQYDEPSQMARIEVRDTGIGVAPAALPCLFLEFEQADASTSRRYGGAGLGLAFTRRLARLLGGDCTLESKEGRGTRVSLSFRALPASPAPAGGASAPIPDSAEGEDLPARREPRQPAGRSASQRPDARPRAARSGGKRQPRILLAEDGLDNQRLISMLLAQAGAHVEVAENGLAAVERLRKGEPFDLILMDMAMPEMDGYRATRTLREMGCELPIVALTAHGLPGERAKCLAAGCDEYATKPIDKRELIRITRDALARSLARRGASGP